jgi:serine/threonine-protein kinase
VATQPAVGTQVAPGSTVTLAVTTGDGSGQLEMPDVTGDKLRDAQRKLAQEGIVDIGVRQQPTSDDSDNGRVLSQSPARGSQVSPNEQVVLTVGVSSGGGSSSSPDSSATPGN